MIKWLELRSEYETPAVNGSRSEGIDKRVKLFSSLVVLV